MTTDQVKTDTDLENLIHFLNGAAKVVRFTATQNRVTLFTGGQHGYWWWFKFDDKGKIVSQGLGEG
jgi:hypothetical protein